MKLELSTKNHSKNRQSISFKSLPTPKRVIRETKESLLNDNVKIIHIYCHNNADEDTFNTAKVYANWLISKKKKVSISVQSTEIKDLYLKNNKAQITPQDEIPDKVVIIDFNGKERIPKNYSQNLSKIAPQNIIGFDHHATDENKIAGNIYIDTTAKSCASVITRFFEGIGKQLSKTDTKSLYCAMISDYKKSGLIKIVKNNNKYALIKTEQLNNDKNSLTILNKLESKLNDKDKTEIYKHLDLLTKLNDYEKKFRQNIFSKVQVSPNGKLAYLVVEPDDKLWQKIGMDTVKSSEILKDFRVRTAENSQKMQEYSNEQKLKLKNVDTVVAFYRSNDSENSDYRISIHSKSQKALEIINFVKSINPLFIGNGHKDRAGGGIQSIKKQDTHKLIEDFIKSSEIL